MIEKIVDELREKNKRTGIKKDNEYTVSELLQCRRKSVFIRDEEQHEIVETNTVRQGWIGSFVRDSAMATLQGMENAQWTVDVKFTHEIGGYVLTGYCDAWRAATILMIKCPMRPVKGKKIPDAHKLQAMMLLNLTDAERCRILYLHKEGFREMVVTDAMRNEDIVWIIQNPVSPYYVHECDSCFYKNVCDIKRSDDTKKRI